jgi:nucleoside-diphosphate-sugar epimerase
MTEAAFVTGGSGFIGGRLVERLVAEEAYFVTDGEPAVFREFVTAMLETQVVEPPNRSLPAWTAGPLARIAETAWKVLPLEGNPPMTAFRSWLLTQECTIDISKARSELGYTPIVTHEQGLAELAA